MRVRMAECREHQGSSGKPDFAGGAGRLRWAIILLGLAMPMGKVAHSADAGLASVPYVLVLGTAQDAGAPQAGCTKECCRLRWEDPRLRHQVSSLAIVDPGGGQAWIIDATPDFPSQFRRVQTQAENDGDMRLSGLFLTHAHVGHYVGLIHLGREVMGAAGVPVHAMPRMKEFLENNGPWELLVRLGNISLQAMRDGQAMQLAGTGASIEPFLVPHRDEYSETVGFLIRGPHRKVLYIPDIDKWERWDRQIESLLHEVDVAYLDGTFYSAGELPGRDMSQIPHPFIIESIRRFGRLPQSEREKIRFIHLNHTNPALQPESRARREIRAAGLAVAQVGERVDL